MAEIAFSRLADPPSPRTPGRCRTRRLRKFVQNPAHQILPQLRDVAVQDLRHHFLDDLFHSGSLRHGRVSCSAAGSGFFALHLWLNLDYRVT